LPNRPATPWVFWDNGGISLVLGRHHNDIDVMLHKHLTVGDAMCRAVIRLQLAEQPVEFMVVGALMIMMVLPDHDVIPESL
jgi:hypothetical protein